MKTHRLCIVRQYHCRTCSRTLEHSADGTMSCPKAEHTTRYKTRHADISEDVEVVTEEPLTPNDRLAAIRKLTYGKDNIPTLLNIRNLCDTEEEPS